MDNVCLLTIDLEIQNDCVIDIEVQEGVGGGGGELPYYTGNYEVVPKVTEQKLPTAKKSMAKDVTVLEIPFEEVHNITGTTVTIGGIL